MTQIKKIVLPFLKLAKEAINKVDYEAISKDRKMFDLWFNTWVVCSIEEAEKELTMEVKK